MQPQLDCSFASMERDAQKLRGDFAEHVFEHSTTQALDFLLKGVADLLGADMAFCAFAPRETTPQLFFWYRENVTPLVCRERAEDFVVQCGAANQSLSDSQDKVELLGVPLLTKSGRMGAMAVAGKTPQSPAAWEVLMDLGSSIARLLELKSKRQIHDHIITAVKALDDAAVLTDSEGIIEFVNPSFETLTGYFKEEALGQKPSLLQSGHHDEAFYRDMWQTLLAGRAWRGQITNRRKDGSLFQEETSITPIKDEQGRVVKFFGLKRDISEQLSLQKQLWQSQKMETVGLLAGGIAHDYNNALGVVLGFADLALNCSQDPVLVQEALSEIKKAAQHSSAITSQLLGFARKQVAAPVNLSISDAVSGTKPMLRHLLGEQIEIRMELGPQDVVAYLDPNQLQQILTNLFVNARNALGGVGTIQIKVDSTRITSEDAVDKSYVREGTYARLVVEDNGCGMSQETRGKVFEPFFTTNSKSGNGLGMSTVYGIVKQNRGFIDIESEEGVGTKVIVYFPLVTENAQQAPPQSEPVASAEMNYRVLLVEDDPALLKMTSRMLTRLGCRVTQSQTESEALAKLESEKTFDLLVTDMILSKGTGVEVERLAKKIQPQLRTLFVSGYTQDVILSRTDASEIQFLKKPFTLCELRGAVLRATLEL